MKTRFTIAASMLAGAALGGAAIQALHAQAKPPVYMIAINEVSNQEGYAKEYVSPAQKSVKDHGGEYVAAGPGTQVAGNLPHGPVVILRWDSMEALQAWHNSPRFSGRAQDRREIREIQHRRGQWPKIAVAHSRPRDAKGDPDLAGRDADTGLWHVRRLMTLGITVRNG
jgi:uncharacterized protein (DUF1330 family)